MFGWAMLHLKQAWVRQCYMRAARLDMDVRIAKRRIVRIGESSNPHEASHASV